jgi:hypothetical protein
MNLRIERYEDALRNLPASGGGGCHAAMLRVANLGVRAGLSADQIAADIAANVHGSRKITAKEISEAVSKAFNSKYTFTRAATVRPAVDGAKLLDAIVKHGADFNEEDLWEQSPTRTDWEPEQDGVEFLRRLFDPEDRVFIGARYDATARNILPVREWIRRFESGENIPPHVICNPLTGAQGQTKDGKPSYRADSCVAKFKFAMIEFDTMPRDTQIRFWAGVKLPIVALIDSGGKSIHGWIRIDAADANEWTARVEGKLFDILRGLGVDGTSKNESRLSRMPGHFRKEKKRSQRILYLNLAGGTIQ